MMKIAYWGTFSAIFLTVAVIGGAESAVLAPTPPMGWNSWDSYGTTVKEAEVKANADYMGKHLKAHGWQYIVVDIQWYEPNAAAHGYRAGAALTMDQYGRLTPAENRFPSAKQGKGFKPLADYVHAQGLKFGIHILRGIPRQAVEKNLPILDTNFHAADVADKSSICPWNTDMYGVDMNKPGAQLYVDSLAKLYASWGVDYIKADDEARPLHRPEVAGLHKAIEHSGRPMVLSLSPGPTKLEDASFLEPNAQLWRVSDDLWDKWPAVEQAFEYLNQWSSVTRPGNWPDADMLPLGRIGIRAERGDDRQSNLTHDEQRSLMTLWSIARSPLMFGGDLPSNNAWTLGLMTNDEVLAVGQHGKSSHQVFRKKNQVVWTSEATDSNKRYLAVFNLGGEGATTVTVALRDAGATSPMKLRDLWEKKDLGVVQDTREFNVPAHGAQFYSLTPTR